MTGVNESIQPTPAFPIPEISEVALVPQGAEIAAAKDHIWRDRILGGLLLAAAGASLVFEQSPANEALRVSAGLNVLKSTMNELAVGGVVGAITYGIEMGSSGLIAAGLNSRLKSLRSFSGWIHDKMFNNTKKTDTKTTDKITDMGIALGIGAGLVAAKRHVQNERPSLKQDLSVANKASLLVAGVSGSIGVLAAGGIEHAEKIGLGKPAEYIVNYGTDWKFWLGVVGVIQGGSWLKNKIKNRGGQEEITTPCIDNNGLGEVEIDQTHVALEGEQI